MMDKFQLNLTDVKLILSIISTSYLYLRKKLRVFLHLSIALVLFFLGVKVFLIQGGIKSITLAVLLCLTFAASWKEIMAIDKLGISAREMLRLDKYDLIAFAVVTLAWISSFIYFVTK